MYTNLLVFDLDPDGGINADLFGTGSESLFDILFKESIWIPFFIGADMIAGTRGAEVDTTGRTTAVGTTGDTIGTNVSTQKCLST